MSSRIRREKSKNIKRLNQEILNESKLLTEIPNCGGDGSYCTGAISCGGDNAFHGCVQGNQCVTDTQGSLSDYHMCSASGQPIGGGTTVGLTGTPNKDIATKPTFSKKPRKKLKEGCGCDGAKETSEDSYMAASQLHSISNKAEDMYNKLEKDEVLDDWVESHLAKIDQMMDSVSDSFNHDESKDMGDMGTGGCPPGHHWCAASNSCRADNPPQMEPLTLMGTDVISLDESIKKELRLVTEQYTGPAKSVYLMGCDGTNIGWWFVTVGGATPQIGDVGHIPPGFPHFAYANGKAVYIVDIQPPYNGTGGHAFPIQGIGMDSTTGLYVGWNSPTHPNAYPGGPMWPFDLTPGDGGGFGAPSGCPNCTNWVVSPTYASNNPGGCNNQTQSQGDWWCDPTGAYVNPNGGNCAQSPNQPQSYFTGPYTSEADCNAQCSSAPTTGCDQSAWSNYSTWLNNFTSLPNFSSSNPNQPCQFLCQRNTLWGDALSTGTINGQQMGPNWTNQIQCKYDEVQDLMNTHNCSSSNAPAC